MWSLLALGVAVQAQFRNECRTAANTQVWLNGGCAGFFDELAVCGRRCRDTTCTNDCIREQRQYGVGCATCFAQLAMCAREKCGFRCRSDVTNRCVSCIEDNCSRSFIPCSGIPKDEIKACRLEEAAGLAFARVEPDLVVSAPNLSSETTRKFDTTQMMDLAGKVRLEREILAQSRDPADQALLNKFKSLDVGTLQGYGASLKEAGANLRPGLQESAASLTPALKEMGASMRGSIGGNFGNLNFDLNNFGNFGKQDQFDSQPVVIDPVVEAELARSRNSRGNDRSRNSRGRGGNDDAGNNGGRGNNDGRNSRGRGGDNSGRNGGGDDSGSRGRDKSRGRGGRSPAEPLPQQRFCADRKNILAWTNGGCDNFATDLSSCAVPCKAERPCVANCMMEKGGYSANCANCFGATAECAKDNCVMKCLRGVSDKCTNCIETNCTPSFEACSGILRAELDTCPTAASIRNLALQVEDLMLDIEAEGLDTPFGSADSLNLKTTLGELLQN